MNNTKAAEAKAAVINQSGFAGRIVGYATAYIPMSLIIIFILAIGGAKSLGLPETDLVFLSIGLIPTALPFIIWEIRLRNWRRANGLPVNKNIAKELAQMEVNQRVAIEQAALKKAGTNGPVDKTDLGYWHGLLQQGAITEEEYQSKKKELM